MTGLEPTNNTSKRGALILLGILTSIYVVSVIFNPSGGDYATICGFKNFTGLPCPACGLTHSFCSLGKGELAQAFQYNAIGPPLFLFSLLMWIRSLFALTGSNQRVQVCDRLVKSLRPVPLFLGSLIVFGLVRIVYLLVVQPPAVKNAPFTRLLTLLFN